MNLCHIKGICSHFNLGSLIEDPAKVSGGLLHQMWRINTDKDSYAIKQLSKDIDLNNNKIVKNYNTSETIAEIFKQNSIPTINAIEKNNGFIFVIDNTGYLTYPWTNAKSTKEINESKAIKIAKILLKMHSLNLQTPQTTKTDFTIHQDQEITNLFKKAKLDNLDQILLENKKYQNAIPYLKTKLVISHGDLDPKNVLWDENDNPYLIDWESARLLNPSYEIINTSLDFCSISESFNQDLFIKMIKIYGTIRKNEIEYAFSGILGNWIDWLVYNIKRSFSENIDEQMIGIQQIKQTILIILKIIKITPKLIETLEKIND